MADNAPIQPSGDPAAGGDNPPAPDASGNQPPAASSNPPAADTTDLSKLSADQLTKVLENPELFKLPRIAELLEQSKEFKLLKDKQAADQDASLAEQKKFEELANKRGEEVTTLKGQIEKMTIDQALTNKLVPEGVVDLAAALTLADRSKLKIDDNGNVSGVDEALAALKTDKAYLFGKGSNPVVGSPTGNNNQPSGPAKFKRSQLRDQAFYAEHRAEILEAQKNGLIEDDIS